ncbi:MAG: hypothetical protein KKG92_12920, partial [Gammaproteobacteria bacterium]|nr:hypothetical protein [Gammaproteobacteria bacterium]
MERKPGQRGLVRVAACILALLLPLPSSWASSPFAGVGVDGGSTDAVGAPPPKRGGFAPASDVVAVPVAEPSGDTRSSTAPSGDFRAPAATDGRSAPEVPFPGTRGKPFQPPKLMVPRVLGMYPDQLTQGTSYSVTLNGENLNPTLKVDFGAGILTKGAPVQLYGGKLKVVIDVLPFADTGKRKLKIGTPFSPLGEQTVEFEVKQKMAMATQSGPKAVQVKFPPADLKIVKGVIQLIAPAWRKQIGQEKQEKDKISGKPLGPPVPIWQTQLAMIDDALLFVWQEQNQGMAERFEIRFFKGDKLLVKRDIPVNGESGQPHYRPD